MKANKRLKDMWSVIIVSILAKTEKRRYAELHKQIGDISPKMLAKTLKNLEKEGIVKKTIYPEIPIRVEYELTDLGESLLPEVEQLENLKRDTRADLKRIILESFHKNGK